MNFKHFIKTLSYTAALALASASFFACSKDNSTNIYYTGDDEAFAQATARSLQGSTYKVKKEIYGAFANQYSAIFKDYKDSLGHASPLPASVKVVNSCEDVTTAETNSNNSKKGSKNDSAKTTSVSCSKKKVLVKTWIKDYSDTATATGYVDPDSSRVFEPVMSFNNSALAKIKAPVQTQIQIRAYALENDNEILFYSASELTTLYPMQIFDMDNWDEMVTMSDTTADEPDSATRHLMGKMLQWYAAWVTPNMDSITDIQSELVKKLPKGMVIAYDTYEDDTTVTQSTLRLIKAVYEVLQSKGIHYVNDEVAIDDNSEKIKYPVEVLRSRQANCIEGTLLFASILEAMDIEAYIVIVDGHAFLGWVNDPEEDPHTMYFLETTLTWQNEDPTPFEEALATGTYEYQEEKKAGNFKKELSFLISLNDARENGVMPNDIP